MKSKRSFLGSLDRISPVRRDMGVPIERPTQPSTTEDQPAAIASPGPNGGEQNAHRQSYD